MRIREGGTAGAEAPIPREAAVPWLMPDLCSPCFDTLPATGLDRPVFLLPGDLPVGSSIKPDGAARLV
jgi:hypothetical protein